MEEKRRTSLQNTRNEVYIHARTPPGFTVKRMAETLKVSRLDNGCNSELIKLEFERSRRTYDLRRLARQISRVHGVRIGRRRVEELMREHNLVPKTVRKFKAITISNHNYPI